MRADDWVARSGDCWADAIVAAMRLGGVENLYFVSGSELVFFQESIAKAQARGGPAPTLRAITNEHVALNCAIGDAMVRNLPAATAVHVDVGTLHYGAAVHTAWRGGYPVLMTAGTGPRARSGSPGGRFASVHWFQEPRSQGAIVRQYTKVDHRLEHQDDPGLMVSRLLQLALSERPGPAYLTVPIETAMLPLPSEYRFPSAAELGLPRAPAPDPNAVEELASRLLDAEHPLISAAALGRDVDAVGRLVEVAEVLAVPVTEPPHANRLNFPRQHWAWCERSPWESDDLVLVLEDEVPFVSNTGRSDDGVVFAGLDPVQHKIKTTEFRASLRIVSSSGALLRALVDEIQRLRTPAHAQRIERRRQTLAARHDARRRDAARAIRELRRAGRLTGEVVADAVGRRLDSSAIVVNDGVSNAGAVRRRTNRSEPGTYFRSGGSAGGWGGGAAVGAKIADRDRDVVHFTGDGYLLFGCPVASLMAAVAHAAPTLTVVFVNGTYSTGTTALRDAHPGGYSAGRGAFNGGLIEPEPDYRALAATVGAWGQLVEDVADLDHAVERAFDQISDGRPAILAVRVEGPEGR